MAQGDRSGFISGTIDALANAGQTVRETFWVIVVLAIALGGVVWLLDREIGFTHLRCQTIQAQHATVTSAMQETLQTIVSTDNSLAEMIVASMVRAVPDEEARERFLKSIEAMRVKIRLIEQKIQKLSAPDEMEGKENGSN